ncbi:MAG: hypothetical protein ACNA8L_13135 [Luteolibacter sp.]
MSSRLANWSAALLGIVALGACDESEKPTRPAAQPPSVEDGWTTIPIPEVSDKPAIQSESATREPDAPRNRADVLGFARHLPADAEALVTFHEAASVIERMRMMKLWNAASIDLPKRTHQKPEMDDDDFSDLQGLMHEEDFMEAAPTISPLETFGSEITIALGKDGTRRMAAWVDLNRRSIYHHARGIASGVSNPGDHETDMPFSMIRFLFGSFANPDVYGDLIQDATAMRALDHFQIPPIYLAVRANQDRIREIHEIISEPVRSMANFPEMSAPVEVVRAGTTFNGYRMIGADLAKSLEEGREYMAEIFGGDVIDRMIEFLKPRELVAISGILGDYSVVFYGASVDEFQLAESPEHAITHGDTLAFADAQLAHPFHGLFHANKDLLETLAASSIADIALGLRDGLATHDHDGRNRDLVTLLHIVSERERALRALARHQSTGITIVDDGGPRIDAHGSTSGMLDFSSPSRLAALEDAPDLAVFLRMSTDARYSTRAIAYREAVFETSYAWLRRLMESPDEIGTDGDRPTFNPLQLIQPYAAVFENDFRSDFLNIWHAISRDMREGLGRESAIVVDLKGTVPAIPGVPKAIVGQPDSPRATYLAPVVNRERLGAAWEKIHSSTTNITTRIGEFQQREIRMPRPIRSESGSLTSWFLPLPVFDDEFLPSVTLNDNWFAMGTSRNQAVDLIARLESLDPRPGGGLQLKVNFRLIAESLRSQIAILMENRDSILEANELVAAEFDKGIEKLETFTTGIEELETLEAQCWEEAGSTRTRIHLRVNPR